MYKILTVSNLKNRNNTQCNVSIRVCVCVFFFILNLDREGERNIKKGGEKRERELHNSNAYC